ncbi:MAG: hypothetical protein WCR58_06185 [Bacteroidales bacterium]|jgi:hypothetical protein|nr:hypothetical protein [Bacteroidales bacterium]MDD3701486.1 hypothetical protein [Bacteroidales bacterium]MDY0369213.1 hypothetical protein [Bacteroidales bacterium]
MLVSTLKYKNGKTYIQLIDKSSGCYRVLKSFGSTLYREDIARFYKESKIWIEEKQNLLEFDVVDGVTLYNRGYDKYLKLDGEVSISIDRE